MHVSRLIGGGLGVVVAIALGAAASVSPLVTAAPPARPPVAAVIRLDRTGDVARGATVHSHAPLVAWSE
ncbi:MAG TPA: hypothetical protein VH371_05350 [Candidatus Limnocylindrales bacterium]|jgi:hypothetical protein